MYASQLEAYRNVQKTTMSNRELEAGVLTKAAMLLKECQDRWSEAGCDGMLSEALRYNQMLWTFFQGELMQPENPLPGPIKKNLLSLSLFVDRRTFDVMAFPKPEKLTVLININLNIAAGLRSAP